LTSKFSIRLIYSCLYFWYIYLVLSWLGLCFQFWFEDRIIFFEDWFNLMPNSSKSADYSGFWLIQFPVGERLIHFVFNYGMVKTLKRRKTKSFSNRKFNILLFEGWFFLKSFLHTWLLEQPMQNLMRTSYRDMAKWYFDPKQ